MASDATVIPAKIVTRAGKLRLMTLDHLDARTAAARRAIALAEAFAAELGDLTPMQRIRVETAAALSAIAEDAQTRRLAGDASITLDDLVRAVSAARRAVRDLGIDDRKHGSEETLHEYIAKKYGPKDKGEPRMGSETADEETLTSDDGGSAEGATR